mmetsp:Transcript_40683/g.88910  ORF Transcript_40683/g.88910 Transcript_40683/m.88910 type:complete len:264 (-) Transcript_40683:53-844(-)
MLEAPGVGQDHDPQDVVVHVHLLLDVLDCCHWCLQFELEEDRLLVDGLGIHSSGDLAVLPHRVLQGRYGAVVDGASPRGSFHVAAGHLKLHETQVLSNLRLQLLPVGGLDALLEKHEDGVPLPSTNGVLGEIPRVLSAVDVLNGGQLVKVELRRHGLGGCAQVVPGLRTPPGKALAIRIGVVRIRPLHHKRIGSGALGGGRDPLAAGQCEGDLAGGRQSQHRECREAGCEDEETAKALGVTAGDAGAPEPCRSPHRLLHLRVI